MILTNKGSLSEKELFNISLIGYFKKTWWLHILMWLLAVFFIFHLIIDNYNILFFFYIFFICFAIFYPLLVMLQLWKNVSSAKNKMWRIERYYEIFDDKINVIMDEDASSSIKINHFIKVVVIRQTYLLFISKNQYIYIPFSLFKSNEDREWFESEFVKNINAKQ